MILKNSLRVKKKMMEVLESAVDEILEQHQLNEISWLKEEPNLDLVQKMVDTRIPVKFEPKLSLICKDYQGAKYAIYCCPTIEFSEKDVDKKESYIVDIEENEENI